MRFSSGLILLLVMTAITLTNAFVVNDMGCWKDTGNRAIPSVDDVLAEQFGPYTSRVHPIQKCVEYAIEKGYKVFAVQNGGWCATGPNARETYDKYGPSTTCKPDGEGGPWGNQVYEIGTKINSKYKLIGCYKDTANRAIPTVEGRFVSLRHNYEHRIDAIAKCARIAATLNYKVFAVQNGGWCATGPYAHETYHQYGESSDCLDDGKGGPWANAVYFVRGVKIEISKPLVLNDMGCWKDTGDRAIPSVDDVLAQKYGPYTSRAIPIERCARYAKEQGYSVFAVQNGGWCATGPNARKTYDKYGPSTTCKPDGEGGPWGNQIYDIGSKINSKYKLIGCYKDTGNRAIPTVEGRFVSLSDNYIQRKDAIAKCARVAATLNYKVFAVQNGGWCATGPYAHETYYQYGESSDCLDDGEGGPWANAVYFLKAVKIEIPKPLVVNDMGCWKDAADRAIPSVDDVLAQKYGPYTSRAIPIERCARYAKEQGYTVFAVQNGGWCATASNAGETYDKYGPSTTCKPDGEGGPWGNQVYVIGTKRSSKYKFIGCYKDTGNRAIPTVEGRFVSLRDNYIQRKDAIAKCAKVAATLNYKVFAVQNGGWCATGPYAHETYYQYGSSSDCRDDGEGGPWANAVYFLKAVKIAIPKPLVVNDMGCWKDTGDRAIPSVDDVLAQKYGPYTSRAIPIERCARYAKEQGYTVFAVQNGGWCATALNAGETYDKYGVSTTCKPDGEGGPWGNQVYEIGTEINLNYKLIGCFKDTGNRAIPTVEGRFVSLHDNYAQRKDAIAKCARVAATLNYKVFAVQNGGWCATGPKAHETYGQYGASNDCRGDGEGGPWANAVYGMIG